jgi:hypothetical protein
MTLLHLSLLKVLQILQAESYKLRLESVTLLLFLKKASSSQLGWGLTASLANLLRAQQSASKLMSFRLSEEQ